MLPATDPAADYRVRIFTPDTEFPFAGHPTLGTAHALLEAGLAPKTPGQLVQQCGIGLVTVNIGAEGALAFRAPPAQSIAFDPALLPLLRAALGDATLAPAAPFVPLIVDMGIKWLVVRVDSAAACLALSPSAGELADLCARCGSDGLAVYGPHDAGGVADYEVRAFCLTHGALTEDPVTGSANACLARMLQAQGLPPAQAGGYRVRQGTVLGCDGRVAITFRDGQPWIGGQAVTVIDGTFLA